MYSQRILQLKDGENHSGTELIFTVELHVRTVFANGAEQQRCAALDCVGVGVVGYVWSTLLWWSAR